MTQQTFVIVGGGLAAARAIEAIRDGGHQGPVVLVGDETSLPYDRPPLSKAVLAGTEPEDTAYLHPREWYTDHGVDLRLGVRATRLDPAGHTLTLADGAQLGWDRLLLATGSSVRRLDVPGADLAHVLYLRTMAQSANLRDRLAQGGSVVIVGAGWIGLEVAAAARGHGCQVSVIEPQNTPLQGVVGAQLGQYFTELHTSHGVAFRFGDSVQRFVGNGEVAGLITTSGVELSAETIVVGVGVLPNTQLAEQAGLRVDNGIVCDASLRTSAPGVFAAGDVANWFNPTLAQQVRVDHWANALNGGVIAGRAMLGKDVSYDMVPYFFSDQYDIGLEYAGHVPRGVPTELVLRGDPAGNKFMAFWLAEGRVVAGMHVNMWDTIDEIQTLISDRTLVNPRLLADLHQPLKKVGL